MTNRRQSDRNFRNAVIGLIATVVVLLAFMWISTNQCYVKECFIF